MTTRYAPVESLFPATVSAEGAMVTMMSAPGMTTPLSVVTRPRMTCGDRCAAAPSEQATSRTRAHERRNAMVRHNGSPLFSARGSCRYMRHLKNSRQVVKDSTHGILRGPRRGARVGHQNAM